MYRPNTLKQRLRNGENVLGCWSFLGNPQVAEILSIAGFDYSCWIRSMAWAIRPPSRRSFKRCPPRPRWASCACHGTTMCI